MRIAICTVGGDFNDHSKEVTFVNSFMLNSAHQQTRFNVCVQELKVEWRTRRYAWYRWVVIEDFDGNAVPVVINHGGEAHPIKEKIKLNKQAEQQAKESAKNTFWDVQAATLGGVKRRPVAKMVTATELLQQLQPPPNPFDEPMQVQEQEPQ